MPAKQWTCRITAGVLGINLILGSAGAACAQAPAAVIVPPGAVVRRVVMKDALSAEQFRAKLEGMKANGLFRDRLPGIDPKQPVLVEINFLTSGNYLLVAGSREWIDANIETIRLMGYLFERPRAHLQLNLRVVQLTGPANADVIQMSETVRALVDAQRDEVIRTFADLDDYLVSRIQSRPGADRKVYDAARELLPGLGTGSRPMSVPEILLLLMLDRASPAPRTPTADADQTEDAQASLLELPRVLNAALRDARRDDAQTAKDIQDELAAWRKTVTGAREWCAHYAAELKKGRDGLSIAAFREALQQPNSALPRWIARRMERSLEMTERLYPNLVRKHTEASLEELERRFGRALARANVLEQALARGEALPSEKSSGKSDKSEGKAPAPAPPEGIQARNLIALKTLAEELIPAPLALFDSVVLASDNAAPSPEQLVMMFHEYAVERRKLEGRLQADMPNAQGEVNYSKLQTLEAGLNLWLRRVAEAMARSLEQQFYRRYANELRLLANKQLGKGSSRDLLSESAIDEVPDVARDILLADTGVNIFLSNSISLQFSPETMNSVSAQVQSSLPSKTSLLERVQQAQTAASALSTLTQAYGISGESIVKALLAGGQAVPVQSGINLAATPSIGFDASTVTLTLNANQSLEPGNPKVADRVTNHTINTATVTALSYEPMVLSTLASNLSYYEKTGGIPVLRKIPFLKSLAKDIPLAPFREGKRQKGVYQSSVLILEPVVIPTIEDLVRYHSGWNPDGLMPPAVAAAVVPPPAAPPKPATP